MAIKFWTPRHRATLYNSFDHVRLNNFALLSSKFVGDMLDQKITQKALRRIEDEWLEYWDDVYDEEPADNSKLLVCRINQEMLLLLKAGKATGIAKTVHEKYEELFNSHVGEIDEE